MDYGKTPNLEQDNPRQNPDNWGNDLPQRDSRAVGNKVITSPEAQNLEPNQTSEQGEALTPTPETLNPEITTPEISTPQEEAADTPYIQYDRSAIKIVDDKISEPTLKILRSADSKLDQDGNVADYYETIRDMTEANLDNSFGRKLAA